MEKIDERLFSNLSNQYSDDEQQQKNENETRFQCPRRVTNITLIQLLLMVVIIAVLLVSVALCLITLYGEKNPKGSVVKKAGKHGE